MKTFLQFIRNGLSQISEEKEENFPDDVLSGFEFSKSEKLSNTKRDVYIVKSGDRENDAEEILRRVKQSNVDDAKRVSSNSSVDPIVGTHDGRKFTISVKPPSGGMNETTLNASITELFPAIAFEKKYNPKDVDSFMEYLHDVDITKLKCVGAKDVSAAQDTINKADSSSKYKEKMENAIAIHQYLKDTNKDKPIKNVYWGYRVKPPGVPSNHPGDIFIEFKDKLMLGVSLKAGGKKTSEPQLNTYTSKVFEKFNSQNVLEKLFKTAYTKVYSKIKGIPSFNDFRKKDVKTTQQVLRDLDKKNNRQYETLYNEYLEIMRKGIINLFNKDRTSSLNYIKSEVLRDAPDVPTLVIKAVGLNYEEVKDKDALGVFLPQVKFVKAYTSKSSKQEWFIELKSGEDVMTMKMSIRTNKPGHAGVKKLGQFSLAVKYNGLKKK